MIRYIIRRIILVIPVLLGISIFVFMLIHLIPGNVVDIILGHEVHVSAERYEELRAMFGLDKPLLVQYFIWLSRVVRGDLGVSALTNRPIMEDILLRVPVTLELSLLSFFLCVITAIPLGILSAYKSGSAADAVARVVGLLGLSVPNFWLATMLVLVTSLYARFLFRSSWVGLFENPLENLRLMILPSLSLGLANAAMIMRMTRATMVEVMQQEYIMTARAKGLREKMVVLRHALKNALLPVVTLLGIRLGYMMGGAFIIEVIFSLPGLGTFLLQGIYQRDYPLVQGTVLFIALFFVLINLLVDLLYAYLDPKISYN